MGLNHNSQFQIPSLRAIWSQIYCLNTVLLRRFPPFPLFWPCGKPTLSEQQWGNRVSAQRAANSPLGLSRGLLRSGPWPWGQAENGSQCCSGGKREWVEVVHLLLPDSPAAALGLHACRFLLCHCLDAKANTTSGDPEGCGLYLSCPGVSWQQLPVCHWTYLGTN